MRREVRQIKSLLDSLYLHYGKSYLETDPVSFSHRFTSHADIEVVGFLSAALAFGKVGQIKKSIEDLLGRLGPNPGEFVSNFDLPSEHPFGGFKHRFIDEAQITLLISSMGRLIREEGSLKNAFTNGYIRGDMKESLSRFVKKIHRMAGKNGNSLKFLVPDPERGSSCKRLFLYLRWMVRRDDGVDFGIFDAVRPSDLVIPLDTHIARISRLLCLTSRKSMNLPMAIEITEQLKAFDPHDPIKYDFSLTRIGIVEGCQGVYEQRCHHCHVGRVCSVSRTEEG